MNFYEEFFLVSLKFNLNVQLKNLINHKDFISIYFYYKKIFFYFN